VAVVAFKVLVLGGTSEGRLFAEELAGDVRYDVLLSFAGRTASLKPSAAPYRVGGFGGAAALAAFLRTGGFGALIDATHPFAARMSENAVIAADAARVPLLRIEPPAWTKADGDTWIEVADMHEAARALGQTKRRVLLTIGRLEIDPFRAAPQHRYLVRAVEPFPIPLPDARLLAARGPFERAAERRLLEQEAIDVIVSKNAGTPGTYAKIEAARELALPVIMVQRPRLLPAETVATRDAALPWLAGAHRASIADRGE
jgi:precorrin-6A/cobalt-precorrin-6A reductase